MDRVDPQAPARAIEHGREQAARLVLRLRPKVRANRLQVPGQRNGIGAYPAGQHFVDARRHFGRTRLGEGQAEDLVRTNIVLQQQAQHPGRKHLGLARPGRGREPDDLARIDCRMLLAGQREDAAHACSSPRACHSSRRIN